VYLQLIQLGITFLAQYLLPSLTANKAPAELVTAIGAAIASLTTHQTDLITKSALESQRG
jgi:hypothetical protein